MFSYSCVFYLLFIKSVSTGLKTGPELIKAPFGFSDLTGMSRFVVVGSFLGVSGLINRNRAFYVHTSPYISTHMGWFSGWPGISLGYRPDIVLVDLYSPWVDLVHPVSACFIRLQLFGPGCWIVITTGMGCWIVGWWWWWCWFWNVKLNLIFKEKKEAKKRKHAVVSVFCVLIEIWLRFDLWDELLFITEMIDC